MDHYQIAYYSLSVIYNSEEKNSEIRHLVILLESYDENSDYLVLMRDLLKMIYRIYYVSAFILLNLLSQSILLAACPLPCGCNPCPVPSAASGIRVGATWLGYPDPIEIPVLCCDDSPTLNSEDWVSQLGISLMYTDTDIAMQ